MRLARGVLAVAVVGGLLVVRPDAAVGDPLVARGSVNQVQVTGATPGATVELRQDGGPVLATGTVDAQGAFVFGVDPGTQDDVAPGSGYTVAEVGGEPIAVAKVPWATGETPEVLAPQDTPPPSFYEGQSLPFPDGYGQVDPTGDEGFGYVTMRDGTQLSVNVLAPLLVGEGATGPWPVVIDYSGYTPSNPDELDPVATLMRVAGFAVVRANLRGTGCSGGAYSYWEPLQGLDGYDLVEAIAAQPWVRQAAPGNGVGPEGPMVGMYGISFSGISQLFVGRTNPPSLAAIAPTSVIADTYRSTLYPGGILNDGFAVDWASEREAYARPEGQQWAADRIAGGDTACATNQALRLQAPPLLSRFEPGLLYEPDPGDSLAPATFVDEIQVPTFIAGSFQDEQTGGHWATMLDDFAPGVVKRAELYNGTHAEPITPDVMRNLLEFLDLYVARRAPQQKALLRGDGPEQFADIFGAPYGFPAWRGLQAPYQTQAAYEALPPVRVQWERGARDAPGCLVDDQPALGQPAQLRPCTPAGEGDGSPYPRVEATYPSWPVPATTTSTWYLTPDGGLSATPPAVAASAARASSSFRYSTARSQVGTFSGGSSEIWDKDTTYDWDRPPEGDSLRYVTPPFTETRTYAGSGSVDLWVRADVASVDLEVTLTEVRPDGQETYLQSGWLRASHRQEDIASTPLAPVHPHLVEEALPADGFARVRVEIFPFSAIVRPDSRLAITVAGPGGNRPFWNFAADDEGEGSTVDLGHAVDLASALHLPLVPNPSGIPASLPVCGDLRSMPCRTALVSGRATAVTATVDPGDTDEDLDRSVEVDWTAPAAGGVTAYQVLAETTGASYADDATPGYRVEIPVGSPPATDRSYAVRADVSGPGLVSDASPEAVPAHPFTDVGRGAWNVGAVDWVAAWDLAEGFGDGTFRNGAAVTRAQFVSWLWTMFGRPGGSAPHGFADVGPNAWVSGALSWAKAEDIVSGFAGNVFRPGDPINRAQIAQWLRLAADGSDSAPASDFADVPSGAWYEASVNWAKDAGVVSGFAGNQYRPTATATRGQAASMFLATATWLNTPN